MSVRVTIENHRADITLDRPDVLNAMNWEVFQGLAAAANQVAERDDVRAVVVSGAGRSFCSGIDTGSLGSGDLAPRAMIELAQAGFRALASLPAPTIAAVHGHAYGAGLQLALVCDVRIVTSDAKLGLLETNYGIVPDLGGTHRLPQLTGPGRAKLMMWLAERIDGIEAHRRGIAERCVAPDDLHQEVDDVVGALIARPPLATRAIKQLVDDAGTQPFSDAMDRVADAQEQLMASADFTEAISAFVERRDPVYGGR